MAKENLTFEQHAQQVSSAEEHAQEIQQTRIGGLGGSDADLLLRVGRNGLSALTATDMKRLSVMLGIAEQETWNGNAYTNAGHAFEDYVAETAAFGADVTMDRETYIEKTLARNFKTFAHADFTCKTKGKRGFEVVECKYVQKDTDAVAKEYEAQLQWYYLLGAKSVCLLHGSGAVPFDRDQVEVSVTSIERNDEICKAILAGVKMLDTAIADGWKPVVPDKLDIADASTPVQKAFATLERVKELREKLAEEETAAKAVLFEYMRDFSYSSVYNEHHSATFTKESVSRNFDKDKLFKAHPEFDCDEYYKQTKRSASISFK